MKYREENFNERVKRKEARLQARYMGPVAKEQPIYDLVKLRRYEDDLRNPKKAESL